VGAGVDIYIYIYIYISQTFFILGAKWVVSERQALVAFLPGKVPIPILQEAA
jgi:hypothetical protein